MPKVVISDASTLIILHKIGEFELLHSVYGKLLTTPEVSEEFGETLPKWITIQAASDIRYQQFLETQVDEGEASAIALAYEFKDPLLLIDDLKARKLAKQLNLKFTGTLGIIHQAKQLKVIDCVKPIIDKLLSTNFRVSEALIHEILRINNEL